MSDSLPQVLALVLSLCIVFSVTYLWLASRKAPVAPVAAASKAGRDEVAEVAAAAAAAAVVDDTPSVEISAESLPKIAYQDEDALLELTKIGDEPRKRVSLAPPTQKIVYDEDAALDEPTGARSIILVSATACSDTGRRRKRNEDSVLALEDFGVFVVADGMGGYRGGEIASQLAVTTIEKAFTSQSFDGPEDGALPRRASELARAIQMANEAIHDQAQGDARLEGMGTTICAARFSTKKQRLYVGHVGDSRIYRFRDDALELMTTDHTMQSLGVTGESAGHLSRAVGVWPVVPVDIVLGKPIAGDVYILCSDGLSKMVVDADIERVLRAAGTPGAAAQALVEAANEHGGKDNVSVIVVRVDDAPVEPGRPRAAA
jgi:serine/threonine protein phosphatase PrpC